MAASRPDIQTKTNNSRLHIFWSIFLTWIRIWCWIIDTIERYRWMGQLSAIELFCSKRHQWMRKIPNLSCVEAPFHKQELQLFSISAMMTITKRWMYSNIKYEMNMFNKWFWLASFRFPVSSLSRFWCAACSYSIVGIVFVIAAPAVVIVLRGNHLTRPFLRPSMNWVMLSDNDQFIIFFCFFLCSLFVRPSSSHSVYYFFFFMRGRYIWEKKWGEKWIVIYSSAICCLFEWNVINCESNQRWIMKSRTREFHFMSTFAILSEIIE